MNIHSVYRPFLRYFHRRRWERFTAALNVTGETRILDVGGLSEDWLLLPACPKVTLLNIRPEENCRLPQVVDDGCSLPFEDGAFDIVFSNSVIEHLGSAERQRVFAQEIARVGCRCWVQTPNRWFPIEPHLLTPIVQWFPRRWLRPLLPWTVWALIAHPTRQYMDQFAAELRPIGLAEMRGFFPDARMVRERFLGLTKAIIAVRK